MSNSIKTYAIKPNNSINVPLPVPAYLQSCDGVLCSFSTDSLDKSDGVALVNNTPIHANGSFVVLTNNSPYESKVNILYSLTGDESGTHPTVDATGGEIITPEFLFIGTKNNPQPAVKLTPDDATYCTYEFSSSDSSVLDFNQDGTFNIHKIGTVTITCKVTNFFSGTSFEITSDWVLDKVLDINYVEIAWIREGDFTLLRWNLNYIIPKNLIGISRSTSRQGFIFDEDDFIHVPTNTYIQTFDAILTVSFRGVIIEKVMNINVLPNSVAGKAVNMNYYVRNNFCFGMRGCTMGRMELLPIGATPRSVEYIPHNNPAYNEPVINLNPYTGTFDLLEDTAMSKVFGIGIKVTNFDDTVFYHYATANVYSYSCTFKAPPAEMPFGVNYMMERVDAYPSDARHSLYFYARYSNKIWTPDKPGAMEPNISSAGNIYAYESGVLTFTVTSEYEGLPNTKPAQTFTIKFTGK
ncbi:hypothetical protein [Citrobacter sp. Igbk 16]|uniref:hypothetical protein n=1 Tax=Citrobacter sp. Igbk 16 TaxID=2963958 RepID=UPI002303C948|nr:hypothetical protein [Citrobacter sp. Igbk 16]MDA8518692.1 hypothetical protein [Citrobacter sp. Igbk 16]